MRRKGKRDLTPRKRLIGVEKGKDGWKVVITGGRVPVAEGGGGACYSLW
jgi:hypothetical protein